MKNNYNPFTVPENFFEAAGNRAVAKYRGRRRAILYGTAAALVAAALICVPMFIRSEDRRVQEAEIGVNSLASMYEYDIFLQVNFTK